ncbi:MAG: hypothetical protein ACRYGB_10265, partial [Janthinobacterium lividum]
VACSKLQPIFKKMFWVKSLNDASFISIKLGLCFAFCHPKIGGIFIKAKDWCDLNKIFSFG